MTTDPVGVPLVVRTLPLSDPGPLLALLPRTAPLAWVRRGEGIVGWGSVARIELPPGRLENSPLHLADRVWSDLVAHALVRELDLKPDEWMAAIQFLTTPSTNWYAATYGIISTKTHETGAGIAAFYKANDFVGAYLRLDGFGNTLYMPSGNFQLQFPVRVMNKIELIPFATTGIAAPIGNGTDVSVAAIFGAGFAFRLPDSGKWYVPGDVIVDFEKWTNLKGQQIRFGLAWHF